MGCGVLVSAVDSADNDPLSTDVIVASRKKQRLEKPVAENYQAPMWSSMKIINCRAFLPVGSYVRVGCVIQWVSGLGKTLAKVLRNR